MTLRQMVGMFRASVWCPDCTDITIGVLLALALIEGWAIIVLLCTGGISG